MICQRLMVQGLPGTTPCRGPYDIVYKVLKAEGFGITILTQSPASALWWYIWCSSTCSLEEFGVQQQFREEAISFGDGCCSGYCRNSSGARSSVIATPIDTIKTQLQVMDNYGAGRPSVMKTAKALIEEDGWMASIEDLVPAF